MEDIDKLIKETLTEEEAKFYDNLEEQNVLGALKDIFNGKNSWLVVVMNICKLNYFWSFCVLRHSSV